MTPNAGSPSSSTERSLTSPRSCSGRACRRRGRVPARVVARRARKVTRTRTELPDTYLGDRGQSARIPVETEYRAGLTIWPPAHVERQPELVAEAEPVLDAEVIV